MKGQDREGEVDSGTFESLAEDQEEFDAYVQRVMAADSPEERDRIHREYERSLPEVQQLAHRVMGVRTFSEIREALDAVKDHLREKPEDEVYLGEALRSLYMIYMGLLKKRGIDQSGMILPDMSLLDGLVEEERAEA